MDLCIPEREGMLDRGGKGPYRCQPNCAPESIEGFKSQADRNFGADDFYLRHAKLRGTKNKSLVGMGALMFPSFTKGKRFVA
jgi:hypothetical protein